MKCHECAHKLREILSHAVVIRNATLDYKRNKNEVNIFKMENHALEMIVLLDKIDKRLAERIVNEQTA